MKKVSCSESGSTTDKFELVDLMANLLWGRGDKNSAAGGVEGEPPMAPSRSWGMEKEKLGLAHLQGVLSRNVGKGGSRP